MGDAEVEYAVRDGASIAYEVFGSGPVRAKNARRTALNAMRAGLRDPRHRL